MDFSEAFKAGGPIRWSPDGTRLASALGTRLAVRAADSLQVTHLWTCMDVINQVEWSPDGQYVMCAMYKRATVQIWSVTSPDWTCTIDEGAAGLTYVRWSPDSRHVLTSSDFQIRLTIWSLVQRTKFAIQMPKYSDAAICFSNNGKYLAVAERRDCRDYLMILSSETWELLRHFAVDSTDLVDISWSPDDTVICVQDTALVYRALLYTHDGRCVGKYTAYEDALGLKSVGWQPTGRYLALGSYDQHVRLLDHLTWKRLADVTFPPAFSDASVAVFREEERPDAPAGTPTAHYTVATPPISVPVVKPQADRPNPKVGVGLLRWSPDGQYIAARNDNMPSALWIWDSASMRHVALLLHGGAVRGAAWAPGPGPARLALCTGSNHVYMWTRDGALCVGVPVPGFQVLSVTWRSDGRSLLLTDKDRYCVLWPNWESTEEAAPATPATPAATSV